MTLILLEGHPLPRYQPKNNYLKTLSAKGAEKDETKTVETKSDETKTDETRTDETRDR